MTTAQTTVVTSGKIPHADDIMRLVHTGWPTSYIAEVMDTEVAVVRAVMLEVARKETRRFGKRRPLRAR